MWCGRVTVRLSDGAPDSDHSRGMVTSGRQAGEGGGAERVVSICTLAP